MEFDGNKPIYLQIADSFCERVLSGELMPEDRIPSVREFGSEIGVNPNTVARSYERLTELGVIYNRRGIGFFITPDAPGIVLSSEKKAFFDIELPAFRHRAELLGISPDELIKELTK